MAIAQNFLHHFRSGQICLHPTDTLPGLSFDPRLEPARKALYAIKERDITMPVLSLVESLEHALEFWKPLPGHWKETLQEIWPAPLSVIWNAKNETFGLAKGEEKALGLRVPKLEEAWLYDVMRQLSTPFPTTSVNLSGGAPKTSWGEAALFAQSHGIFIPELRDIKEQWTQAPSTVIQILSDGSYKVLRKGVYQFTREH